MCLLKFQYPHMVPALIRGTWYLNLAPITKPDPAALNKTSYSVLELCKIEGNKEFYVWPHWHVTLTSSTDRRGRSLHTFNPHLLMRGISAGAKEDYEVGVNLYHRCKTLQEFIITWKNKSYHSYQMFNICYSYSTSKVITRILHFPLFFSSFVLFSVWFRIKQLQCISHCLQSKHYPPVKLVDLM